MSFTFLTSIISETENFTLNILSSSSTKINPLNESQDSIVSGFDSSFISDIGTENTFEIISEVMNIPISQINDESSPETIESWDSFNGLILVDELESNFNIKFSVSEIVDVKNVKDIKRYLNNHGVDLDE